MESLRDLSVEQLQEMQEDTEQLDHFTQESQEIQSLQLEKEMYLAMNRTLAEKNLALQPRLDTGRACLQEKYEALSQAATHYRQQKAKLDSFVARLDPKAMLPILRDHLRIIEEESEEMAEKFMEGLVPLETFLEEFVSKRQLSHQRRVRVEKLQELLKMQETTSQPTVQPSESQTRSFKPPRPAPPLVDPQAKLGPSDRRPSPPFPLPYAPSPPITDQPLPMGPTAQGGLAPAAFPGFEGPPISQPSPQRTFHYGPPPATGLHQPRVPSYSYAHPGGPSPAPGYPVPGYPQPGGSSYPYTQPGGPSYPQPGGPGPGYPQHQPGGQAPHLYSRGQSQCPYPTPPFSQYPAPSPGFPQPSPPGGLGWPRYPTGQ